MESAIEAVLNELTTVSGVTGALVLDERGLCLASRGEVDVGTSGIIASIAKQARELQERQTKEVLSPGTLREPTVSIDLDSGTILIRREGALTVAIYKNQSLSQVSEDPVTSSLVDV